MCYSKNWSLLGLLVIIVTTFFPSRLRAQANLEDPAPGSFQSGIGMVRGWACRANRVDIVFDDRETLQAAYGTAREDTRPVCGTDRTGFGLLYNWNILGDGMHTIRALADGIEFGRATITVTTLGAEFLRGKSGSVQLFDFPQAGTDLSLRWQESMQNFAIDRATTNGIATQLARGKIMWIAAHPDDEAAIAPLLGDLCIERRQACTFLVATRGETSLCLGTSGCRPDPLTVRTQEMRAAAAFFGATLIQWELPDAPAPTPDGVLKAWASRVGGDDALISTLASAIATAAPDVILTFDPRHGTTCHPDHRAIGALTLAALDRLKIHPAASYLQNPEVTAPFTYLVETRIQFGVNNTPFTFSVAVPDDTRVRAYDANQPLSRLNNTAWEYLLRDVQTHSSQCSPADLAALRSIPSDARRVSVLPLASVAGTEDSRYVDVCGPQ